MEKILNIIVFTAFALSFEVAASAAASAATNGSEMPAAASAATNSSKMPVSFETTAPAEMPMTSGEMMATANAEMPITLEEMPAAAEIPIASEMPEATNAEMPITSAEMPSSAQMHSAPQDKVIEKNDTIKATYITAVREKMKNTTQTGLMRISSKTLRAGYAVMGTPDVIKTLQTLPGVAVGNELMSGLFVHGGDGHDNLFILDGVPIYNISHFGGFFSTFNTDVLDNLDFYKSGFPARFGGKMSSVVDVETKEGDMNEFHGNLSLGLIDGRFQLEGPLQKGKTSFNVGIRRSWMDYIIKAGMWVGSKNDDFKDGSDGSYFMRDFNARLTHKFSADKILNVNFFEGRDRLKSGMEDDDTSMDIVTDWGSVLASANYQHKLSNGVKGKFLAYFSQSKSDTGYKLGMTQKNEDTIFNLKMDDDNASYVRDLGLNYHIDWYPDSYNHVRAGLDAVLHNYRSNRVYTQSQVYSKKDKTEISRTNTKGDENISHKAFEPSVFVEDEIFLRYNLTLNAGIRYTMFATKGKNWHSLEPRMAFKWLLSRKVAAKMSYTRMSQFAHLVSAMYIDLPTDAWMPTTSTIRPMFSDQIAGGIYSNPTEHIKFNVEFWYKTMENLLSYNGTNAFYPPLTDWESSFTEGKGRSYGLETEFTYSAEKFSFSAYYTLSRSERKFEALYYDWFRDRNDNRHKINLVSTFKLGRNIDMFVNWNYHSGNRVTFPTHVIQDPNSGDIHYIYNAPYNTELPDYHRLDLGFNFNKKTKRGNLLTLNLSVYNAYNHLNAAFAMVKEEKGKISGMAYGFVPILPTLSVLYKF